MSSAARSLAAASSATGWSDGSPATATIACGSSASITVWLAAVRTEAASFQLVLIAYLQLHETELDGVLRAAAALAPGGTLLVVGHDVTNLAAGTGGPPDPAVLYTPKSITRSLRGLTIVRAERVRRPVATADGHRNAVDTLVRAIRH